MSFVSRTLLSASSSLRSCISPIASTFSVRLSSSTPPSAPLPSSSAAPSILDPTPAVPYSRFHVEPLPPPPPATWVHPPSSTPAGTPIPEVVLFKDQAVPVALEDSEYPPWLWKLIGEGRELVNAGKEPAERGEEYDSRAPRRIIRKTNKDKIKVSNLLKKR